MDINILKMIELYNEASKHSNYQILPTGLKDIFPQNELEIHSRFEEERLRYITDNLDFMNKTFCDIGANCGFFSFELLQKGAKSGDLYEGNRVHSQFLHIASKYLNLEKRVRIFDKYYSFHENEKKYDFVLLLNVLHHVGDDYGNSTSREEAKKNIICSINQMSYVTNVLILQLGFNWMGDCNKGLFETGTKKEMIEWIKNGTEDYWNIYKIGIAEGGKENVIYRDLNSINIERNDSIGEFLNRPIFILQKKEKNN